MPEQRPEARSAAQDREARRIEHAAAFGVNPSDVTDEVLDRDQPAATSPAFAVRISRGLVTHWNDEPLLTWEQADECRRKIEELHHERGEIEEVLLSVTP